MSPKFSIIIPAYNAESTLRETLDSITDQDFSDYEVILVNDGSVDKTSEVFENWQKYHHSQSLLINQENKGLGAARNLAASKATGEWLCFIDADDLWIPNKLSVLNELIELNNGVTWIYHPVWELSESGEIKPRRIKSISTLIDFFHHNPFTPSAVAVKKDVFFSTGGWEERRDRVEDLGLWVGLFEAGQVPFYTPKLLTKYRVYSGVTTQIEEHLEKIQNVWEEQLQKGVVSQENYHEILLRKNYEAARLCQKSGQFKKAIAYYNKGDKSLKASILKVLASLNFAL